MNGDQPITRADLDLAIDRAVERITQATTEQIAAAERRTAEQIAAAEQRITQATTANLSDLREEISSRFARVDTRFQAIEQRLDRIENLAYALNLQPPEWAKPLPMASASPANSPAPRPLNRRPSTGLPPVSPSSKENSTPTSSRGLPSRSTSPAAPRTE